VGGASGPDSPFDVQDCEARLFDEPATCIRQINILTVAREEQVAQLTFKLLDSLAQC
jgi:hypothetical protein